MTRSFCDKYPKCRLVIDCIEIRTAAPILTEIPSSLQLSTYRFVGQRRPRGACKTAETGQSLLDLHTQRIDEDENPDQSQNFLLHLIRLPKGLN